MALLHVAFLLIISFIKTDQFTISPEFCSDDDAYAPNSTYQSNLQSVLNLISNDTQITYGFYNFSVGQGPDKVSSLGLCRGDVQFSTCRLCMQMAITLFQRICPNNKQGYGWVGYCYVYISNGSIYGQVQELYPWFKTSGTGDDLLISPQEFNISVYSLMNSLERKAASGNSTLKYAAGQRKLAGGQTLYGLVQCTPDLDKQNCMQCIEDCLSLTNFSSSGLTMLLQSCFVWYNVTPFFESVPILLSQPPPARLPLQLTNPTSSGRKKSLNVRAIIAPIGLSAIILLIIVRVVVSRRKKLRNVSTVKLSSKAFAQ